MTGLSCVVIGVWSVATGLGCVVTGLWTVATVLCCVATRLGCVVTGVWTVATVLCCVVTRLGCVVTWLGCASTGYAEYSNLVMLCCDRVMFLPGWVTFKKIQNTLDIMFLYGVLH